MANQSVAPETINLPRRAPDIRDLLIDPDDQVNDHETVARAASSELSALHQGIAGLGKAIWVLYTNEQNDLEASLDRTDMANIGWLIGRLGEYAEHFAEIASG